MSGEDDDARPEPRRLMYHYTDRAGYNGIRAGIDWHFKANTPPPRDSNHPFGVYFTPLGPGTRRLSPRISVPTRKLQFVFAFWDAGDLTPLRGQRRDRIFYTTADYVVEKSRQVPEFTGEVRSLAARLDTEEEEES
jgi:hypothetical protein